MFLPTAVPFLSWVWVLLLPWGRCVSRASRRGSAQRCAAMGAVVTVAATAHAVATRWRGTRTLRDWELRSQRQRHAKTGEIRTAKKMKMFGSKFLKSKFRMFFCRSMARIELTPTNIAQDSSLTKKGSLQGAPKGSIKKHWAENQRR